MHQSVGTSVISSDISSSTYSKPISKNKQSINNRHSFDRRVWSSHYLITIIKLIFQIVCGGSRWVWAIEVSVSPFKLIWSSNRSTSTMSWLVRGRKWHPSCCTTLSRRRVISVLFFNFKQAQEEEEEEEDAEEEEGKENEGGWAGTEILEKQRLFSVYLLWEFTP